MTKFVLINQLEKNHSMIETRRLKSVAIFTQTILSFVLSRKSVSFNTNMLVWKINIWYVDLGYISLLNFERKLRPML